MEMNQIIKKPLLTEKTYKLMDSGTYTFIVNKDANKIEVKNAVEFIFDVTVGRVNIIKVPKKPKKVGRYSGFVPGYKKAIVTLSKGQINFFPEDNISKTDAKKPAKEIKKSEAKVMSDAEKRAAEKIARMQKAQETKVQSTSNKTTPNNVINKKTNRGGDK